MGLIPWWKRPSWLASGRIPNTCVFIHNYPIHKPWQIFKTCIERHFWHKENVWWEIPWSEITDKAGENLKWLYTTFLVSMVTFRVLSINTSSVNRGHFTTCRGTIYTYPPQLLLSAAVGAIEWWQGCSGTQDHRLFSRMSVNLRLERTDQKHFLASQLVISQPHVVHCW